MGTGETGMGRGVAMPRAHITTKTAARDISLFLFPLILQLQHSNYKCNYSRSCAVLYLQQLQIVWSSSGWDFRSFSGNRVPGGPVSAQSAVGTERVFLRGEDVLCGWHPLLVFNQFHCSEER